MPPNVCVSSLETLLCVLTVVRITLWRDTCNVKAKTYPPKKCSSWNLFFFKFHLKPPFFFFSLTMFLLSHPIYLSLFIIIFFGSKIGSDKRRQTRQLGTTKKRIPRLCNHLAGDWHENILGSFYFYFEETPSGIVFTQQPATWNRGITNSPTESYFFFFFLRGGQYLEKRWALSFLLFWMKITPARKKKMRVIYFFFFLNNLPLMVSPPPHSSSLSHYNWFFSSHSRELQELFYTQWFSIAMHFLKKKRKQKHTGEKMMRVKTPAEEMGVGDGTRVRQSREGKQMKWKTHAGVCVSKLLNWVMSITTEIFFPVGPLQLRKEKYFHQLRIEKCIVNIESS